MPMLVHPRFLLSYCVVLTAALLALATFTIHSMHHPRFGVVTARRINIVEPNGVVRLTLSNRADFPAGWMRGKEYPRPDRTEAAGMLFMNDEGTELGGLIWGAGEQPDGTIESHAHLSFDQYEENQIFALDAGREGNDKFSQMVISDQGNYPVEDKRKAYDRIMKLPADQQDTEWKRFFAAHPAYDTERMVMGRGRDGSVGIDLKDNNGKLRIRLRVGPDGNPVFQFFDAAGNPVKGPNPAEK